MPRHRKKYAHDTFAREAEAAGYTVQHGRKVAGPSVRVAFECFDAFAAKISIALQRYPLNTGWVVYPLGCKLLEPR